MSEHDWEPIRGLPGHLPPGEQILWQGSPEWKVLLLTAFHGRAVAIYFGLLAVAGFLGGHTVGALITLGAGVACLLLLAGLAWLSVRTTVYTLTNKRVVLRIGMALPTCFNLPLKLIKAADLRRMSGGHGDIALTMSEGRIGYLMLWPHARPWQVREPQPMLRALPHAEAVAARIARACAAIVQVQYGPAQTDAEPLQPTAVGAAA